jgi:hypothetical protein
MKTGTIHRWCRRGIGAALLCGMALPAQAAEALVPWSAARGSEPPPPWHVSGLPHQSKPFTRFSVERQDTPVLKVESDRSYGNLVHLLQPSTAWHHLSWRWTVDQPVAGADLQHRNTEDMPVRVCVLYDLPHDKIPLVDRALLNLTSGNSDDPVPGATVCYVWDQKLAPGTALHSPFTGRLRMLVLRGHETPLHQWVSESRDLDADFKRLFGEESDTVPPILAVAVGADADNTQGQGLAHVGPLNLGP